MSLAPQFRGKVKMPYPFKYALVWDKEGEDERGTVQAFFVDKTFADRCCNDLNATVGGGAEWWKVTKIFQD